MTDELKPVRCGCGGKAKVICGYAAATKPYHVECMACGTRTTFHYFEAEAIQAWNQAMGKPIEIDRFDKDTNIPYKNATDTNVGDKFDKDTNVRSKNLAEIVHGNLQNGLDSMMCEKISELYPDWYKGFDIDLYNKVKKMEANRI